MHEVARTRSRKTVALRRWLTAIGVLLAVYLAAAYVIIPFAWEQYFRYHLAADDNPRLTTTGDGHPGDPLNVALIGSEAELMAIMTAAGWFQADQLGVKSDLEIAADTVLGRSYDEAPVSRLFLFGRKQDLAFEQPVGDNPRQRNHVRFWRTTLADAGERPAWIGAATYDERVGFSRTTGQITHHIAADVDAERDHLFADLEKTSRLVDVFTVAGFHTMLQGRNGGGDPWHTDGDLSVGVIAGGQN